MVDCCIKLHHVYILSPRRNRLGARLLICALWSPAGKRADLLALVCGV